jgi:aryl-alcohol dehydrogenase-like predicted oxidoreductase
MTERNVQLGLGLINIGMRWGARPVPVPGEAEAAAFLKAAYGLGFRLFDTAPSYGNSSEVKLGVFLRTLSREERGLVTVATKFGEHWDNEKGVAYGDHSYDALCRSVEQSLRRLGSIDLLQLHRTTVEVLRSADLAKAWEFALKAGVKKIGVSASYPDSAALALELGYGVLQMPYNVSREDMAPVFHEAAARGIELLINRPYHAGARLYDDVETSRTALFAHVLSVTFQGWVLTGTRSLEHLKENLGAFRQALDLVEQNERATN